VVEVRRFPARLHCVITLATSAVSIDRPVCPTLTTPIPPFSNFDRAIRHISFYTKELALFRRVSSLRYVSVALCAWCCFIACATFSTASCRTRPCRARRAEGGGALTSPSTRGTTPAKFAGPRGGRVPRIRIDPQIAVQFSRHAMHKWA
jgi:hypothetical protein